MPFDIGTTGKTPVLERELKLYVPAKKQKAVERELTRRGATMIGLHAIYFDTAKRELALAGMALRLRLEGTQWMQTLKMPGPDEQSRIELNHERPQATLDLSLYEGTAVERLLRTLHAALLPRYETQIERLVLRHTSQDGTVELAYDTGLIKAGELSLPVSELELEYVAGKLSTLFDIGKQWLTGYGLIMDLRSKAERGDALANLALQATPCAETDAKTRQEPAQTHAPTASLRKARKATRLMLSNDMSITQAYLACANDCLNQIVRNSAYLAGVDHVQADADQQVSYTHQARVGMRRLRSCWRFFADLPPRGGRLELDERALALPLRPTFEAYGKARDLDVIRQDIEPRLRQAGMSALRETGTARDDHAARAVAMAAHPAFQSHLLELAQHLFIVSEQQAGKAARKYKKRADSDQSLHRPIVKKLSGWQKKIAKQGAQFTQLTCEQQHDLRKKIKRLRYATEFSASLLDESALAQTLPEFQAVQDILGDINDLHTAQTYYQTQVADQPQAWFALGWLAATQEGLQSQAQHAFDKFAASMLR